MKIQNYELDDTDEFRRHQHDDYLPRFRSREFQEAILPGGDTMTPQTK